MNNTIKALSNMSSILEKPRKKYQFYHENFNVKEKKGAIACA
jgi:hypothetical protein